MNHLLRKLVILAVAFAATFVLLVESGACNLDHLQFGGRIVEMDDLN